MGCLRGDSGRIFLSEGIPNHPWRAIRVKFYRIQVRPGSNDMQIPATDRERG